MPFLPFLIKTAIVGGVGYLGYKATDKITDKLTPKTDTKILLSLVVIAGVYYIYKR